MSRKIEKALSVHLFLDFPKADYTRDRAEITVTLALQLPNRWPWAQVHAPALVQYVTAKQVPNRPLLYPAIGNNEEDEIFNTPIRCIDLETGEPRKSNPHVNSKRDTSMRPPISCLTLQGASKSIKRERRRQSRKTI